MTVTGYPTFPTAIETEKALGSLCGLRLERIQCIGLFRVFRFSASEATSSDRSNQGDWALHVDCPWRLEFDEAIVVGSDDWFEAESLTTPPKEWDPEAGGSFQEAKIRSLLSDSDTSRRIIRNLTSGFWVKAVAADNMGGCEIRMSGNITLRIFPDSVARECWRILKHGDLESHFVIPPKRLSSS